MRAYVFRCIIASRGVEQEVRMVQRNGVDVRVPLSRSSGVYPATVRI